MFRRLMLLLGWVPRHELDCMRSGYNRMRELYSDRASRLEQVNEDLRRLRATVLEELATPPALDIRPLIDEHDDRQLPMLLRRQAE